MTVSAIGVFEADANARRLSAEAAANNGFELEKAVDRAIFRAKERFGSYLANSQSKSDFDERWSQVKPEVIKVIAEVTTPTPGVIRRVGAALRPAPVVSTRTKQDRPSSAKTASSVHRAAPEAVKQAGVMKTAWSYDQSTKLWTSNDPMQKFACPDCGTEQDHLGLTHCAGCDRTWNSWPVRQQSSAKTSASTYMLMAREIKMRGDQFKMAAAGNVKIADDSKKDDDDGKGTPFDTSGKDDDGKKTAAGPGMPGMSQPNFGTMPGDNSGAMGSPAPAAQPATPGAMAGDTDNDGDVAGGITEGSPIDEIQDALEGAVMALKEVQMLSINPVLAKTASAKVADLRTKMDRFWGLHKQMNYIAGMLAKEANEAIRAADPRITSEAEFVRGFQAAAKNEPLPEKTGRAYLEGYVAYHKQADSYSTGADIGRLTNPTGQDESTAGNEGSYLDGTDTVSSNDVRGDAGTFDSGQPAAQDFARETDRRNSAGGSDRGQGQSGSIQPTGSRRAVPKAVR